MLAASEISPEIAAQRGYRSVLDTKDAEACGFADYQCRVPALLMPSRNAAGENGRYQLRPDNPRTDSDGKVIKYETPAGMPLWIDVPAAVQAVLDDPSVSLAITEGFKKVDAMTSAGLPAISLLGVWGWRRCFAEFSLIDLKGRTIYITFDSDAATNPNVRKAENALAAFLTSLGARVRIIRIPPGPNGEKQGADDYLAAGHTADDLKALAGPVVRISILQEDEDSREARLEAALKAAEERAHRTAELNRNKEIKTQRASLQVVAWEAASAYDGGRDDDGWIDTWLPGWAEKAGKSDDRFSVDLETMHRDGLVEKRYIYPTYTEVDPSTGEMRDGIKQRVQIRIPDRDVNGLLVKGTTWKPSPPPKKPHQGAWGGKREPCPKCGSTNREVRCLDCGHVETPGEAVSRYPQDAGVRIDGGTEDEPPASPAGPRTLHPQDAGIGIKPADDWSTRYRAILSDAPHERHDDTLSPWPAEDEAPPDDDEDPFAWEPPPPLTATLHGTERCPECRAPLKRDGTCGWAAAHRMAVSS